MNTRTTPSTSPAATARMEVPTKGSPESTAPVMVQQDHAMRVKLDDLEDNPTKYTGKTVTVSGQVEKVFGPRLFTIDEPHWMDVEGETLVYMPTNLAALVRDDDRVTVTGEVRRFARADVEREWGWPDTDAETLTALGDRPVLMASRIVGGDDNVALSIATAATGSATNARTAERSTAAGKSSGQAAQMPTETDSQRAVGTSGTSSTADGRGPRVTDLATITHGDDDRRIGEGCEQSRPLLDRLRDRNQLDAILKNAPIRHGKGHALIVVEDHAAHFHSSLILLTVLA